MDEKYKSYEEVKDEFIKFILKDISFVMVRNEDLHKMRYKSLRVNPKDIKIKLNKED